MKDIFSIIIDKSVESKDGSARVLNIDDVFTGLEEQGIIGLSATLLNSLKVNVWYL